MGQMEGVKGVFDHTHVPGANRWGPIIHDEEVFASQHVIHVGQVIAVVVAENQAQAQRAAHAVQVQYEDLPAVISIEDAIAASSYIPVRHLLPLLYKAFFPPSPPLPSPLLSSPLSFFLRAFSAYSPLSTPAVSVPHAPCSTKRRLKENKDPDPVSAASQRKVRFYKCSLAGNAVRVTLERGCITVRWL